MLMLAILHIYTLHDFEVVREGVLAYARQQSRFPAASPFHSFVTISKAGSRRVICDAGICL